jgi:hypothetical protein
MIERIIASDQTGAGRAAVDAAVKLGIPHGGLSEDGETETGKRPPAFDDLQSMPSSSHSQNSQSNIQKSDGTLMLTQGESGLQAAMVKKIADRLQKPMLHIDLGKTTAFTAATLINDWIIDHDVRVLNVTGPRHEEVPHIYQATLDIIQAVFFLNLTEANMSGLIRSEGIDHSPGFAKNPETIEDAVGLIVGAMSLKDKATMANLRQEELAPLQLTLGLYIKSRLERWQASEKFCAACVAAAEKEGLDVSNPTMVLIKRLWRHLRDTHRLRRVK